jgi:hypothetical protein
MYERKEDQGKRYYEILVDNQHAVVYRLYWYYDGQIRKQIYSKTRNEFDEAVRTYGWIQLLES